MHSNCFVDEFSWICILLYSRVLPGFSKHCSVIPASSVVRATCSPSGPRLLQTLLLRPACHSLVLQAGDADLQDKKSSKKYWPLFRSHSYKNFFSPQNFGMLLSETIQSWKSLERLILSYISSVLFGIYDIGNFSGYIAEICLKHGACRTLVLYLMLH